MSESNNKPARKTMSAIFSYNTDRFEERMEAYDNMLAVRKIRIAIPSALSTISTILPAFQSFFRFRIKKQSPSRFAAVGKI